jgi:tetratricopeptide (TPR) repeat protein
LIAARRCHSVRSIADLTWAIEHGADLLEFRFYLGCSYAALERYSQAIPHFEKVTRAKHPRIAAEGYVYLASCRAALDELPRALADYQKAVDLSPEDCDLRCERIEFAMSKSCFDLAIQDLDFVAPLRPEEEGVFWCRALARLLSGKDPSLARADLDRAIAIEPRLSFFYVARTFAYFKQNEYAGAFSDVIRTCATIHSCEFKLTYGLDLQRRKFWLGIEWRLREKPHDKKIDNKDSSSRKLVGVGLDSLLGSGVVKPRLN